MMQRTTQPTYLDALVREKRVIVCCGAGGVGKTTTAAALGLAGARKGRRTIVLTIDPARRLAEAMGLSPEKTRRPEAVPADQLRALGVEAPGQLHAWMLSPRDIVDEVVRRMASSAAHAEAILANRLYRQFSDMVIGLQEYTAGEALHMATVGGEHDLVILDTPPSRNALEFLDAPRKLALLLDERVIGLFMPRRASGLKGGTAKLVQKAFSAVFGAGFFHDLQQLLVALSDVFGAMRRHVEEVRALLASSRAAFLLVTGPDPSALAEAEFFHGKLDAMRMPLEGYVLNRSWAYTRGFARPGELRLAADAPDALRRGHEKLVRLAETEWAWAERDRRLLATLCRRAPAAQAIAAPNLGEAIESLDGLARLAQNLLLPDSVER